MKRNIHDLTCYNANCGEIGKLQTLFNIPVIANDTISINMLGAIRLAQLKRYLTLDVKVDLFAFYVKHRFIYGDDWVTMIKAGMQDTTVLGTTDISSAVAHPDYLGNVINGTVPNAYLHGYNMIWNEYFRVPNTTDEIPLTTFSAFDGSTLKYGRRVARLPAYWNTGIPASRIDATDYQEVNPNASGNIELLDIARIQAEYSDQLEREWFMHRYRDVIKQGFGSTGISIDADDRPELLMHQESWLSGYDVDGTDDASLGNYIGKSQGMINFQMPPKYFNEHGMLWVMAVLRFPAILQDEKHYLSSHTWDYDTIMGDPNVFMTKPPLELEKKDFVGGSNTNSWGIHPYGQHYRTQPNNIHAAFHALEGFPFIDSDDLIYSQDEVTYDYNSFGDTNDYFNEEALGHWNMISRAEIESRRIITNAGQSIFAGSHLK